MTGRKPNISYKVAGVDGIFGTPMSASGLKGTCTAGGTSRYVLMTALLDDTDTGAMQTTGLNTLHDITINYSTGGGIFPDQRLRGGKTLQQSTGLQPLDTA